MLVTRVYDELLENNKGSISCPCCFSKYIIIIIITIIIYCLFLKDSSLFFAAEAILFSIMDAVSSGFSR